MGGRPACEIFFSTMVLHDLLRHIRILSILRAHFGLIRWIHRQINARGRLAYRLVIKVNTPNIC